MALLLSLCACGRSNDVSSQAEPESSEASSAAPAEELADNEDILAVLNTIKFTISAG